MPSATGYTFMAGGAILLLGGALVLFGTRERFSRPSKETLAKGDRLFSLLAYGGFPAMLALFFFFHFTVHFVAPILPLFIETMCDAARGGVASTTGMLFAISGGTAALSAGGIGYLSDRIGYQRILLFHLLLTAVSMLLHGAAQGIFHLVLLRILYGLAAGGILPTMNALVGRLIPPDQLRQGLRTDLVHDQPGDGRRSPVRRDHGLCLGIPLAVRLRRRPDDRRHPARGPQRPPPPALKRGCLPFPLSA